MPIIRWNNVVRIVKACSFFPRDLMSYVDDDDDDGYVEASERITKPDSQAFTN